MDNEWLSSAREALARNDLGEARELLRGYVRTHRGDRQGWYLLNGVTDDPDEQVLCQRMLQLLGAGESLVPKPPHAAFEMPFRHNVIEASKSDIASGLSGKTRWVGLGIKIPILILAIVLFPLVVVSVLPMLFGYRTLAILSSSMEPTIAAGSLVLAAPVPSQALQIGNIVAFPPSSDAELPTIRRIVSVRTKNGTRYYTTRGDAINRPDPTEISLPPTAWIVSTHVPLLGYVTYFARSSTGIVLLAGIPLLLLIVLYRIEFLRKPGLGINSPARQRALE